MRRTWMSGFVATMLLAGTALAAGPGHGMGPKEDRGMGGPHASLGLKAAFFHTVVGIDAADESSRALVDLVNDPKVDARDAASFARIAEMNARTAQAQIETIKKAGGDAATAATSLETALNDVSTQAAKFHDELRGSFSPKSSATAVAPLSDKDKQDALAIYERVSTAKAALDRTARALNMSLEIPTPVHPVRGEDIQPSTQPPDKEKAPATPMP